MIDEPTARQAGSALFWKAVQHTGVKAIFFVRLIVLARLLSPDDFGLLAISMVALEFMGRVTDLGMIPALVQRTGADNTHYDTAWTVGVVRAVTIAGLVFLAAPFISQLFNDSRATPIIRVLMILPLIEASASIKVAELLRTLRFRSLAFIKLPEALANTVVSIALAPSLGVWALVAGALAGPTVYLSCSYILAPHQPRFCLARRAAHSLIRFGRWIFLNGLIAVSGAAVLRLVISRQLGTAELGLYFLGAKLAFFSADVASDVIGEVTFPLYARLQSNLQQLTRAFQSVLTGMFALLVPVSALLIVLAPSLVENVLGARWEGAVPVVQILAFAAIIGLLGDTVTPILKGLGQPYKLVIIEASQTLIHIGLIWIFTARWGLAGAAVAWLPAITVSLLVNVLFVRGLLNRPFAGLGVPLLAITAATVIGAVVAVGIEHMVAGLSGLLAASLLAALIMGALLWASDRHFALGLRADLSRAFPQVADWIGYSPGTADRLR